MKDMDMLELFKWITGGAVALLAWLYRGHENRITALEITRVAKADADTQRQALRDEVKEFRGETNTRLETLRVETNERFDKLFDQVSVLSRRL